ncbi:hypothetical protein BH23ACT4_BH23ACT4_06980 [soil metagenome]
MRSRLWVVDELYLYDYLAQYDKTAERTVEVEARCGTLDLFDTRCLSVVVTARNGSHIRKPDAAGRRFARCGALVKATLTMRGFSIMTTATDQSIPKRILTYQQAAEFLNTTVSALRNQRHVGSEPGSLGYPMHRRKIVFDLEDLNGYLDRQKQVEQSRREARSQ